MAWIKEINKNEDALLKEIYDGAEKRTGEKTANVLKVHSIHPEVLKVHMALYETIMFHEGPLTRTEREMIGVVVSRANECPYCIGHHGAALYYVTQNKELMEKIADDYLTAHLDDRKLEICKYADKLTQFPYKMEEKDIDQLREVGLNDIEIFDVNQIVAYFNYVNRIVHGLGVELE